MVEDIFRFNLGMNHESYLKFKIFYVLFAFFILFSAIVYFVLIKPRMFAMLWIR